MTQEPTHGALRLRYTALSDVGRVRKDNQDSGYAGPHFLAIADGVGGSARGDVASSTAISELRALDVPPGNDPLAALAEGIDRAHQKIAELVDQHPELDGTSTTVTAAIFDGTRIGVGHVGDSRGYLLRDGKISQLTKDHTFVQSLIDEGRITEEESRVHPHRNLILRAVDGVHETEPDLFLVDVSPGDRLMLCSDGASGVLDDAALGEILRAGTAEACAVELIREALEAGSSDNVTVVVADVVDSSAEDPEETQAVLIGPVVVGAAAERRKGLGSRRQRKKTDTGELEPVPAQPGDRSGEVDPEEIRYAPRPPRRFVWLRRIAVLAVVGVLLWVSGSAAYAWTQKQYYIAPSADHVAIYRGVEADLPVVRLHRVYETSQVKVGDLPDFFEGQVRDGMGATNLDDARAIVQRLQRASDCAAASSTGSTPSATPSATPTASPTVKPTTPKQKAQARASRSASPRPSSSPSSSPSPSATPSGTATPDPGTECDNTP